MKKIRISILTMGLIVALMSFMSCNDDCSWDDVRRPTALVTVYPNGAEGFSSMTRLSSFRQTSRRLLSEKRQCAHS